MSSFKPPALQFLALGDSYTIGEAVAEEDRWPSQLAKELTRRGLPVAKPEIIATTGWRTDELLKAIDSASLQPVYDFVSLLIGVNNQYQGKPANEYATEFEVLLNKAIHFAKGDNKSVLVVSIPDYGYTPFGSEKQAEISKQIDEFNKINKGIADAYKVDYINITDISRKGLEDPSLVASDGLHPSGKMYSLWVQRMLTGFIG
jgi:lysophospholipase L1-like esterase